MFVKAVEAKQLSKNRSKGAIDWKPVRVTKETVRAMLIEHVLLTINKKLPKDFCYLSVLVQQNNQKVFKPQNTGGVLT